MISNLRNIFLKKINSILFYITISLNAYLRATLIVNELFIRSKFEKITHRHQN
jgi:hypothetical protein